jgi:NDP-sugar pyrophosphorylase family protein
MNNEFSKVDVVILCGGRGERLKSVTGEHPKVLAKIGRKAFLDILLENIMQYGFRRVILSVGYLREAIITHFENNNIGCSLEFSEEEMPLGTGGAVKRAQKFIKSRTFFVLNGDSMCKVNLADFYRFHVEKSCILSLVIAESRRRESKHYGSVKLDDSFKIRSFREKVEEKNSNLINAGIYLMRSDIFSYMPNEAYFSLEYDLFPKVLHKGCYGFLCESELIDIGTPERYRIAVNMLSESN